MAERGSRPLKQRNPRIRSDDHNAATCTVEVDLAGAGRIVQRASAGSDAADTADQQATLGTIIVTAEKRSDIRQVPISISEIDAEQLEPRTIGIGFDAKF